MKRYPVLDKPTPAEAQVFGLQKITGPFGYAMPVREVEAEATGEKRPPKKGEWYLSGAVVGAYKAPADFPSTAPYQIARLVRAEPSDELIELRRRADFWQALHDAWRKTSGGESVGFHAAVDRLLWRYGQGLEPSEERAKLAAKEHR